jgi:FixJ family two-component response regulator
MMTLGADVHASVSSPAAPAAPIVFVVDDDISVRESLASLLDCVGLKSESFASAHDFLARPRPLVPSCLLLDVNLPDLSGLDLQKRVVVDRIDMPIIFITGYGDIPMTVQAMKAGAVEFLTKPLNDEALLSAIRLALERSRASLEDEDSMRSLNERYASLSRREREVMTLVVSGLLNKQVGSELGISEITVKAHRGSVMRKLAASSLPTLVNMAARLGLPSPRR